jgi:hypothetical protein
MYTRDRNFYDVIAYGLAGISFQEFIDRYESLKYNVLDVDGFSWDDEIQTDFTYEQLSAELGVATLPTYVDIDSPPTYKSQEGFKIGTNKIPRFKHGFAINEKIIREQMLMLQRFGKAAITQSMQEAMMKLLFDNVNKLIQGNYNALTYQRMQVVSTGQFSITIDNNPQGIVGLTFDFGIPAANREVLTGNNRWWTSSTHTTANEGSGSNPIKFLKDRRRQATKRGIPVGHYEMSQELWDDFLTHSEVMQQIGLSAYPQFVNDLTAAATAAGGLGEDKMKTTVEKLIGCPIVVRDTMAVAEKINKTTKKIEKIMIPGFDIGNVALVPNGSIGTIKAVEPIAVPDPGARIALYDGGRTILKQTFDSNTNTQYISSECTALTVPSAADYMCVFRVTA